MKKLFLAVVVLVAFGAAAAIAFGNLRAHGAHRGMIQGVQEDGSTRVVEESFTPGLTGATSLVRFEIQPSGDGLDGFLAPGDAEADPAVGFRMESQIEHGAAPLVAWLGEGGGGTPVVARVRTTVALDGVAATRVREALGDLPPLEIDTTVRASGVGESSFRIRPHQGEGVGTMGAFAFDWKGLDGQVVFTEDLSQLAGKFTAGGLEIDGGLVRFGMHRIEGSADYASHASGLPVGRWTLAMASMEFEPTLVAAPAVSLSDWKVSQESQVEGGRYDIQLSHAIQQVKVGEDVYGPNVIDFGIRNVDAQSFGEMQTALSDLRNGDLDDQAQAALGQNLMAMLPALVVHSPEVELAEASVETPQGLVRADFKFVLDGENAEMLGNPLTAPGAIRADASAEMPADIFAALVDLWAARQVAERAESGELRAGSTDETLAYVRDSLIHNLRKAGYVVFDGERYETRIAWGDGGLKVNGLPVNPLELSALTGGDGGAGGGLSFPDPGQPGPAFGGGSLPAGIPE